MIGESIYVACKFVFMPRFERAVKQLKKRFRSLHHDVEKALGEIELNPSVGTVIPNDYLVRKLRVASRDMQRGKSGGFRLLYRLSAESADNYTVYLLFLYAKSDQENVTMIELEALIRDLPTDEDQE